MPEYVKHSELNSVFKVGNWVSEEGVMRGYLDELIIVYLPDNPALPATIEEYYTYISTKPA